jgi:hypothetical protein
MFFKREKEQSLGFSDHMDRLRSAGYSVQEVSSGIFRASQGNLAAVLQVLPGGGPSIADCGLLIGQEVAVLTDIGFQKIFLAPSGKRTPALADHLKALHCFKENLAEALGLTSLYNQGLGTTNEKHLYDRVKDRDQGPAKRPWERA